jgi:hypothetical protein
MEKNLEKRIERLEGLMFKAEDAFFEEEFDFEEVSDFEEESDFKEEF